MANVIVVCGYGPGISKAVAEKFGAEGFSVALVARNADKLGQGVKELEGKGVKAAGFSAQLGDPKSVKEMLAKVRSSLGPVHVLQWTAYSGAAGDLLKADAAAIHEALDIATVGLVTAVQEALPDLKKDKGAVLVTNGGFGYFDSKADSMAVQFNAMGLALANSAKHKLVRMLSEKLKGEGAYVGEVMVLGTVKGTAFDSGHATVDPKTVANKFWDLYKGRGEPFVNVS